MPDAPEELSHKWININPRNLALNAKLVGLAAWGTARVCAPCPADGQDKLVPSRGRKDPCSTPGGGI